MSKRKRRRRQPTAQTSWIKSLTSDILAGILSGLVTAAILKVLNW